MDSNSKKAWAYLVPFNFNIPIGRITKTSYTVGRDLTCDLILHEPYISHKHITINKRSQGRGHQFTLVCHSKNKIYLNTNPITDSKNKLLKNNDQIWLVHRSMIPHCRQIGFLFKTEDISESQIILQKYERELIALEKFTNEIKLMLKCTRCNQIMPSPISLQPCCHKVCQNCGIWMIENLMEKCLVQGCNKKILTLMEDGSFSNILKAYNKYKYGQEKASKSFYFSQNPFLMQNWIKHNKKSQSKPISQQSESKNSQKQQQRRNQKVSEQRQSSKKILINKPIQQSMPHPQKPKSIVSDKPNSQQSILQVYSQGLQLLYNALAEIHRLTLQHSVEEIQVLRKNSELDSQRLESTSFHPAFKHHIVSTNVQCQHCQRNFRLNPKKILEQQCQVCLHSFCNRTFPPCKNGDQPLKSLPQRLAKLSKEHISSLFEQNLRKVISSVLLVHIVQNSSQLSYMFKYVLLKNNWCFNYALVKENSTKRVEITLQSCICDGCWPSLAHQMILIFLKCHQNKLKTFSRKEIEQMIGEVRKSRK